MVTQCVQFGETGFELVTSKGGGANVREFSIGPATDGRDINGAVGGLASTISKIVQLGYEITQTGARLIQHDSLHFELVSSQRRVHQLLLQNVCEGSLFRPEGRAEDSRVYAD